MSIPLGNGNASRNIGGLKPRLFQGVVWRVFTYTLI